MAPQVFPDQWKAGWRHVGYLEVWPVKSSFVQPHSGFSPLSISEEATSGHFGNCTEKKRESPSDLGFG